MNFCVRMSFAARSAARFTAGPRRLAKSLIVPAIALCLPAAAPAAGVTRGWDDSAGDNQWSSSANWNPGGVPGSDPADGVQHNDKQDEGTVTVDTNVTFATIQVGTGMNGITSGQVWTNSATWVGDGVAGRNLTITGGIYLAEGYAADDSSPYTALYALLTTSNLNIQVGTPSSRGVVRVGQQWGNASGGNRGAVGRLTIRNGAFTAYLSSLRIGYTAGRCGTMNAALDLGDSTCTSSADVAGDIWIGYCADDLRGYANGQLYLRNASVSATGDLRLSRSGNATTGLGCTGNLTLYNSIFSLATNGAAKTLYMGGATNTSESYRQSYSWATATVAGRCSGLDLGSNVSWSWVSTMPSHSRITVTFASDPEAGGTDSGGWYWGFRWRGDHVTAITSKVASGQFVINTSGLSPRYQAAATTQYDAATGYTYVGFRPLGLGTVFRFR